MQNELNLALTLGQNVSLGNMNVCKDNEIWEALHCARASELGEKMDQKLNTYLTRMFSEDGVELSIGQHQKIALARAFCRNGKVAVWDEPSSSLDPEAEDKIFQSIQKRCENKIVIFTSHRLSNITIADIIIVMENGMIVESGTKEELLDKHERFSELYEYQAKKYI